jgi:methionyl-tRNA formyltransferase
MKILYLGNTENTVYAFLSNRYDVTSFSDVLSEDFYIESFDWIISYGYRYIINDSLIKRSKNPIINLHISYLPYNRGADPNFWSWLDNTVKGVSIHQIDSGIDTGDILVQKIVDIPDSETLESSYNILQKEIECLFIENFDLIANKELVPRKQSSLGSFHTKSEKKNYEHLLTNGWKTPVKQLIK